MGIFNALFGKTQPVKMRWQHEFMCNDCGDLSKYRESICAKCGCTSQTRKKVHITQIGDVDGWDEYYRIEGKDELKFRGHFCCY
jgi:uncharacterized OB-fold protein